MEPEVIEKRIAFEKLLISRFSTLMKDRLKNNRSKGHWKYNRLYLLQLLSQEVNELIEEMTHDYPNADKINHEASDVAVLCAFIAWNMGDLFSAQDYSEVTHV
jgi:NTP pyrophosphatase (non-canonical NTP hydrolase)